MAKMKREELQREYSKAIEQIHDLHMQLQKFQDKQLEEFEKSDKYNRMLDTIESLELEKSMFANLVRKNDKVTESLKAELKEQRDIIQKLKYENEVLKNNIHNLNSEKALKKHNERGAGRKSRFSVHEIEVIKMYRLQGKTIKEIAQMYECSVGLIHKLITE